MKPKHHPSKVPITHPVVLYDGVCNFCNAIVNFIIKHDHKKVFLFAPIQSKEARALLRERNEAFVNLKTVYLIEGEQVYKRSAAVFRIFKRLTYPWKLVAALSIMPRSLTDFFYKLVAKHRYVLFGRRNGHVQPDEQVKERFLTNERLLIK